MKNNWLYLSALVLISSCSKLPDPTPYSWSLVKNGSKLYGNSYQATYLCDTNAHLNLFTGTFFLNLKIDSTFVRIKCQSHNYLQPNSYIAYPSALNVTDWSGNYVDSTGFYTNNSGILYISQIDTINQTISGNFQFPTTNIIKPGSANITNGQFNHLSYVVQLK